VYTGSTRASAVPATGGGVVRAEDRSLVSACVAAGAIVVTKNKRATEIASRGIAVRSLSRRASRRATPTDTRRPVSKVRRVRQRSRISPEHLGGGGHCQGAESTAASAGGEDLGQHERGERDRQQTITRKGMASEHPKERANPRHPRNVAQSSPIYINRTADSE